MHALVRSRQGLKNLRESPGEPEGSLDSCSRGAEAPSHGCIEDDWGSEKISCADLKMGFVLLAARFARLAKDLADEAPLLVQIPS